MTNKQEKNSATEQTKNRPYVFVQKDGDDFTSIKLTNKKYNGIIYHYGKVGFAEKELADGTLPMQFDYTVTVNPDEVDIDNQDFIDYIGDILHDMLVERYTK